MAPTTKADPIMPTPGPQPGASESEPSVSGKNDFFWSNKLECHATRKKAMLQKYGKQINELMGIEWKTKWICLFVVTFHIAVGVYAVNQPSWLVWFLCCYIVGGTCTHNMFLAIHEVTHYTAFKSKFLNDLLAMWCNIPTLIPYAMHFKEYHYEHHRYLGWDGIDPDLPTALEARLLNGFWGKLFFLQFQVFFYAFRPMLVRPKFYNAIRCLNALFIFVADFALYKFFGLPLLIYMFTALWLGAGISPFAGHFLSEHYLLDQAERANHNKQEAAETHSYYGWLNIFAWNVGLHNEHHDFPNVPWSKLRDLHALAPEFYDNLPKTDSWFLCQMRFLFDPNTNEFCRIRREKGAWARKGVLIPTTPDTKTMGAITSIQ